jgi:hypothetical protein
VKIDGSKLDQISHFGVAITKSVMPKDKLDDVMFLRAALNDVIDHLVRALVAPAVDADGKPLSFDAVPEIHKRLLDERTVTISLVVSEVKP